MNAYGSELLDLPVTFRTEYLFATPNDWRTNTADVCTDVTVSFAPVGSPNITGNTCVWDSTAVGSTTPPCPATLPAGGYSGKGCATAPPISGKKFLETCVAGFAGDFNMWLQAPGASHAGSIDVTATVPTWLQYPWAGGTATNPSARATFGIYKSPLIYRRENY